MLELLCTDGFCTEVSRALFDQLYCEAAYFVSVDRKFKGFVGFAVGSFGAEQEILSISDFPSSVTNAECAERHGGFKCLRAQDL